VDSYTDYYERSLKERNASISLQHDAFEFVEADLATAELGPLLDGVDGVFHLAAQPGVRGSWGETFSIYVRDNVHATQRLFEAAAGRTRVVFASSSSIYGNAAGYPTDESTLPAPVSPYGVTKLFCENLARAYNSSRALDVVALRYFTVYGPRQRPDMAFTIFSRALLDGVPLQLFGGEQTRDFTYVADAVSASIAAMDRGRSGAAYNVGGGSEISLLAVFSLASELSGRELDLEFGDMAVGDVRRTAADISLARAELGWAPMVSVEEGLAAQFAAASERRTTAVAHGV
jgi:nucleoside-diphosphate-sugar epimerase